MNDLFIRIARQSDTTEIRDLVHKATDKCYTPPDYTKVCIDFMKDHHSIENISKAIAEEYVLVAEIDNKLIATGALNCQQIHRVFIDTELQGTGIGRAIMAELEKEALRQGRHEVTLHSHIPPTGFYQKLGYIITEEMSKDIGGFTLNFYEMKKKL